MRIAIALWVCGLARAGEVNLARLPIATVYAPPGQNGFEPCGDVRKLFDGARTGCKIAGNVLVRFRVPVTVSSVVITTGGADAQFSVHAGASFSHLTKLTGNRTLYKLPEEQKYVYYVEVGFYSMAIAGAPVEVEQIEILGTPPEGVDLTPGTPLADPDAVREERERAAAAAVESARVAREGRAKLEEIRAVRAAVDKSTDRAAQAAGWMRINEMAKDLASLLGGDERQKSLADAASALGVAITLCEPSGLWAEGNQGYEKYLELTPDGPKADIAWWKGRVESSCGDGEGTADEYRWAIATYPEFLRHFPKSQFAAEARAMVTGSREGLRRQLNLERKK